MTQTVEALASQFCQAFYHGKWEGDPNPSVADLSIADAYTVQDRVAELRCERGEEVVGYKVGCTSEAIRRQFGLTEPISGRLFRPHVQEEGVEVDWTKFANCAIEPEIVLTIGADLRGTGFSDDELIGAIESVRPGIELHHFRFWHTPPTSQELICSGGIHAGLIAGEDEVSPKQLSFKDEVFSVRMDGELVTEGPSSKIMGGPIRSLRWLVDSLNERGRHLPMGSLVIPGSPVELVCIDRDADLRIEIEGVGVVDARFREGAVKE